MPSGLGMQEVYGNRVINGRSGLRKGEKAPCVGILLSREVLVCKVEDPDVPWSGARKRKANKGLSQQQDVHQLTHCFFNSGQFHLPCLLLLLWILYSLSRLWVTLEMFIGPRTVSDHNTVVSGFWPSPPFGDLNGQISIISFMDLLEEHFTTIVTVRFWYKWYELLLSVD